MTKFFTVAAFAAAALFVSAGSYTSTAEAKGNGGSQGSSSHSSSYKYTRYSSAPVCVRWERQYCVAWSS